MIHDSLVQPIAGLRDRSGARSSSLRRAWKHNALYLLLLLPFAYFVIFQYVPLVGNIIAFKDYRLAAGIFGSPWVGLKHFRELFADPMFGRAFRNTVTIGFLKLVFFFPAPIVLALLLNEVGNALFKRTVQTLVYLPNFLSWVIFGSLMYILLAPQDGPVNVAIQTLGGDSISFMNRADLFQPLVVVSEILKSSGWAAIIYLAALTSLDPQLYEAAKIDGAGRWQLIRHITVPGIATVIATMFILQTGHFMSVGFDQIFVLQNPITLPTGDIIDTLMYRDGIQQARFDFTTAIGIFNGVISFTLLVIVDRIAKRLDHPGIL
jgi:putative aldouronate transport system permease protein